MSKKFEDFFAAKRMVGLSQQNIPVKLNDRVVGSADVKDGVVEYKLQPDALSAAILTQPEDAQFSVGVRPPITRRKVEAHPGLLGSVILSPFGAPDTPRDTMFKSPDYPALAKRAAEMDWHQFHLFVLSYLPAFPSKGAFGMSVLNKLCAASPEFAERMTKWCELNDEDPVGTRRMMDRILKYAKQPDALVSQVAEGGSYDGTSLVDKLKDIKTQPAFVIDSLSVDEFGKVNGLAHPYVGDTKVAMRPLAEAIRRSGSVDETGAILNNHVSGDLHVFMAVEAMIGEEKIYGKIDTAGCRMLMRRLVSQLLKVPGLRKGKVLSLVESITKAFDTANQGAPHPDYETRGKVPVKVTAENIWHSFSAFNREIRNNPPRHLPIVLGAMVAWLKEAGFTPISVEEAYMEHKR
jgi:hypothetical protein